MPATRIMLVEDEAIIAMDLSHHLETYGYQVVATAASCKQTLQRIPDAQPDLIIMDIMIKGPIDGIETAEQVRKEHHIPVIFLSANSDPGTVARARAAGAYGYLVKPFRPEELRASIEVALFKAKMEAQLRQSEQWFAKTLHCISDAVIATDSDGSVRFVNPVAERLTGWTHAEAFGRPVEDIVQTLDEACRTPINNPIRQALKSRCVAQVNDTALMRARDGATVAVDEGAAPIVDDEQNLMGAVLVFRDITQRRAVEQALRESEERFHSAFDHASIGMALVALDGRILQNNASIARMFGYTQAELLGMSLRALSHPDDLQNELNALGALAANEVPAIQLEKRFLHRDGHAVWTLLNVSMVRAADEAPLYCIVQTQDLSARRRAEEQLIQMAHHDLITGLVNRPYFIELGSHVIALANRRNESFGVLFLDLDGFKAINDSLGHQAGDTLLAATAERLRRCLRDSDVVGRWGGDEFVMIAESAGSKEQLERVAGNLLKEVGKPLRIDGEDVAISASIGIAIYPRDGQTLSSLVVNADSAMYQAKEFGKNQFCFATKDSAPALLQQSRLENQLRHAVERAELRLYYQPVVHRGRIDSVEALLRWQHPERGLMAPDEFIPIAEKSGLILPIGEWVLNTACRQAHIWRSGPAPALNMAVNVSARQLRSPAFVPAVAAALAASGLPPQALELEVTESWVMGSVQHSARVLGKLAKMGVKATVDDFGTGYSSLAYLKRLPLSRLKIDKSFLLGVPGDVGGEAIVRAIVSLARELHLEVIAEGVETDSQIAFMLSLGDLFLQGFGLHLPMDANRISSLLAKPMPGAE